MSNTIVQVGPSKSEIIHWTMQSMRKNGSGFSSRLAEAWQYADLSNRAIIERSFEDVIARHWRTFQREIEKEMQK